MPPSNPFSKEELEELIEVLRRSADSTIALSASINKQTVVVDKLISPFEQLRRDIADIKMDRELDSDKLSLALTKITTELGQLRRDILDRGLDSDKLSLALAKINTDLAVLAHDVDEARDDVKSVAKEVTGVHKLPVDSRTGAERLIDRLEASKTSTKIFVVILLLVFGVGGFTHLIIAAITGG